MARHMRQQSEDLLADWIAQLRLSVKESSERGLIVSTKWATDMLNSIPAERRSLSVLDDLSMHDTDIFDPEEQEEEDFFAYARQVFDAKEFQRTATILRECKSSKAVFLRLYARYLESEKAAQLQWLKLSTSREQPPAPINNSLLELLELASNSQDPWVLFLQSIIFYRLSRRQDCVRSTLASISMRPWNWSAWELLSSAIETYGELEQVLNTLPLDAKHPMTICFRVKIGNDFYNSSRRDFVTVCTLRRDYFCNSTWLAGQAARVLLNTRDLVDAEKQFDANLAAEPYRLDDIDAHTSVLWLADRKARIAELAKHFAGAPQDKPEYFCLLGNHYSARREHEKAVRAFRKATYLDRTYGAAWTLMGHEYYDLANYHAAIESYRRAIDVNAKDYRAWSGLGRSYSQLRLHHYAIYYNKRSTEIKPGDPRSWMELGESFEDVNKYRDAIACARRAIDLEHNPENAIRHCFRLGMFYRRALEHPLALETYLEIFKLCREDPKLLRLKENIQAIVAFAELETTHEHSFGNQLDAYLILKNAPGIEETVVQGLGPAAAREQREHQAAIKEYMKDNAKDYARVREMLLRVEKAVWDMSMERRHELRRRSLLANIPGLKGLHIG